MLIQKPVEDGFTAMVDPSATTRFWFTTSIGPLESDAAVRWIGRCTGRRPRSFLANTGSAYIGPMRGMGNQLPLFDPEEPSIDRTFAALSRQDLGRGAWIDLLPEWVCGSHRLFDALVSGISWRSSRMKMYDRVVDQPRLSARLEKEDWSRTWPILAEIAQALSERYEGTFHSCWLNLYRDGRDSVAWHGDRQGRARDRALVANVSLGHRRRFRLRAKGGGPSLGFDLGQGDLLVMGGTCQRTFEHAVPKVAHAEPRISITFHPRDAS